jgi:5-methylthioadenosine/S-adenosylhomocysteine deaminase
LTTLVEAGLALPSGDASASPDFAVAIDGRSIVATGGITEMRARYPDAECVGGSELVLIPAMVDSHDHGRGLGTTPMGVPDDLLEVWIIGLPAQPRIDPYLLAVFDGLRLVRSGVSAVLHNHNVRDMEHLDDEIEATLRGYRDVGIRVAFDLPIADQNQLTYDDPEFLKALPSAVRETVVTRPVLEATAYFDLCARLARERHDAVNNTVSLCVGPSGPQWASDQLMVDCVAFAHQHGLRMHVHALETWYQREYGFKRWGTSVLRHLDALGLLGSWLTLAHAIWIEPDEPALLADREVAVAHNPSSNLRLRSGIASLPRLLEAGVALGVGLDGHALDDDQDYLRELRLAWTLANRPGVASSRVDAGDVWRIGSLGGAAITFGADVQLGRLEPGALADLVLLERGRGADDWSIGLDEPAQLAELLLRGASRRHVRDVMIDGQWVVRDARSTRVDEVTIADALRDSLRAARPASPIALAAHVREFYRAWGGPSDWAD